MKSRSFGMFDRLMPGVGKSLGRRTTEMFKGAKAKRGAIPQDASKQLAEFISAGRVTRCPEFTPKSSGFEGDEVVPRTAGRKANAQ